MPKVETLPTPDNVADALTIAHVLIDPSVEPELHKVFGTDLEPVIDNARALAVQAMDKAMPSTSENSIWEAAQHASNLRYEAASEVLEEAGPPSLTGDLADIIAEPVPFGNLKPHPFTPEESKIVFIALHRAADQRNPRAIDLLDRLSGRRVSHRPRVGRLVAVAALGLLKSH